MLISIYSCCVNVRILSAGGANSSVGGIKALQKKRTQLDYVIKECQSKNEMENHVIMFVSCINLWNVMVSSLHADLMF